MLARESGDDDFMKRKNGLWEARCAWSAISPGFFGSRLTLVVALTVARLPETGLFHLFFEDVDHLSGDSTVLVPWDRLVSGVLQNWATVASSLLKCSTEDVASIGRCRPTP